jgi:hypothetical protein
LAAAKTNLVLKTVATSCVADVVAASPLITQVDKTDTSFRRSIHQPHKANPFTAARPVLEGYAPEFIVSDRIQAASQATK